MTEYLQNHRSNGFDQLSLTLSSSLTLLSSARAYILISSTHHASWRQQRRLVSCKSKAVILQLENVVAQPQNPNSYAILIRRRCEVWGIAACYQARRSGWWRAHFLCQHDGWTRPSRSSARYLGKGLEECRSILRTLIHQC